MGGGRRLADDAEQGLGQRAGSAMANKWQLIQHTMDGINSQVQRYVLVHFGTVTVCSQPMFKKC